MEEHVDTCTNCGGKSKEKLTLIDQICYKNLMTNLCSLCTEAFSNKTDIKVILENHRRHYETQDNQNKVEYSPGKKP